jgi:hypothetical protein
MSTTLALVILSWVAIVVLYLGLASVQREVRQLRQQLAADRAGGTSLGDVRLPAGFASRVARPGADRVVLVADSTCPLCQHAAGALAATADQPVLLTYEPAERWPDLPDAVELVQDREAWSTLAHLSPPVVLRVTPSGEIGSLELPTTEAEIARALSVPSLSTAGGKP